VSLDPGPHSGTTLSLWCTTATSAQHTAICYANQLLDVGAVASIGSVGDSYDNADGEVRDRALQTECVRHNGPWRSLGDLGLGP
jgi:putative transposase